MRETLQSRIASDWLSAVIRNPLVVLLVLIAVSCVALLGLNLAWAPRGLDGTDEAFYIRWIANPTAYTFEITMFGDVLAPLWFLSGESLSNVRRIGHLILFGSAFWAGWASAPILYAPLFRTHGVNQHSNDAQLKVIHLCLATVCGGLVLLGSSYFWLTTPNYNWLTVVVGLWVFASLAQLAQRRLALLSLVILPLACSVLVFAKPTAAIGFALVTALVILLISASNRERALHLSFTFTLGLLFTGLITYVIGVDRVKSFLEFTLRYAEVDSSGSRIIDAYLLDMVGVYRQWIAQPVFIVVSSVALVAISFSAPFQPDRRDIRYAADVGIVLASGIVVAFSEFSTPARSLMSLSLLLLIAFAAGHFAKNKRSLPVLDAPFVIITLAVLLPFISAIGTRNAITVNASLLAGLGYFAAIACFVRLLALHDRNSAPMEKAEQTEADQTSKTLETASAPLATLGGFATIMLLFGGLYALSGTYLNSVTAPYRLLEPLWDQDIPITSADGKILAYVDETSRARWQDLIGGAKVAGLEPGDPMIDLAGLPGAGLMLGASSPGTPWLGGPVENRMLFLSEALKHTDREKAYLLTATSKGVPDERLRSVGIDLTDYIKVHTSDGFISELGGKNSQETPRSLHLWRPKTLQEAEPRSVMVGEEQVPVEEPQEPPRPEPDINAFALNNPDFYQQLSGRVECGPPRDNLSLQTPLPYFLPTQINTQLLPEMDGVIYAVSEVPLPKGLELNPLTGALSGVILEEFDLQLFPIRLLREVSGQICVDQLRLYFGAYPADGPNPAVNAEFKLSRVFGYERSDKRGFQIPYGSEFFESDGETRWIVTDCAQHRFVVFDGTGVDLDYEGVRGEAVGEFNTPADVKQTNDGGFLVVDELNDRIVEYAPDFKPLREIVSWNGNTVTLNHPLSISVDRDDTIFVTDYGAHRVIVSPLQDPIILWKYGKGTIEKPERSKDYDGLHGPYYSELSIDEQTLYVVDRSNNRIVAINRDGEPILWFGNGATRTADGAEIANGKPLNFPHEVAVGPDEKIYVADTNNFRIVRYRPDGQEDFEFGDKSYFGSTKTIAVSPYGDLLITNIAKSVLFYVWEPLQESETVDSALLSLPEVPLLSEASTRDEPSLRGDLSGSEVHYDYCRACHRYPASGAPYTGSRVQWQERLDVRGYDTLVENAINGYRTMPSKGGCYDCTDAEVKAAVDHMLRASGIRLDE